MPPSLSRSSAQRNRTVGSQSNQRPAPACQPSLRRGLRAALEPLTGTVGQAAPGSARSRRRRRPAPSRPEASRTSNCPSAPMPTASPETTGSFRGGPDSTSTRRPARTSRRRSPSRRSPALHLRPPPGQPHQQAAPAAAPGPPRGPAPRAARWAPACPATPPLLLGSRDRATSAAGSLLTFRPMPATAHCRRSASMEPSSRMPHTFLLAQQHVVGPLDPHPALQSPAMPSRTSATARAAASESR